MQQPGRVLMLQPMMVSVFILILLPGAIEAMATLKFASCEERGVSCVWADLDAHGTFEEPMEATEEHEPELMNVQMIQKAVTLVANSEKKVAPAAVEEGAQLVHDLIAADPVTAASVVALVLEARPELSTSYAGISLGTKAQEQDAFDVEHASEVANLVAFGLGTKPQERDTFGVEHASEIADWVAFGFGTVFWTIIMAGIVWYLNSKAANPTFGMASMLCACLFCPGGCLAFLFPIDDALLGPPVEVNS